MTELKSGPVPTHTVPASTRQSAQEDHHHAFLAAPKPLLAEPRSYKDSHSHKTKERPHHQRWGRENPHTIMKDD